MLSDDGNRRLQALADHLAGVFPDRDVALAVAPDGQVAVRIDEDWWTLADDGVGMLVARYEEDVAHVVRLDDEFRQVEAYTVRLGDPDSN